MNDLPTHEEALREAVRYLRESPIGLSPEQVNAYSRSWTMVAAELRLGGRLPTSEARAVRSPTLATPPVLPRSQAVQPKAAPRQDWNGADTMAHCRNGDGLVVWQADPPRWVHVNGKAEVCDASGGKGLSDQTVVDPHTFHALRGQGRGA